MAFEPSKYAPCFGFSQRAERAAASLAKHPEPGRPGEIPGIHELIPRKSYRLAYEVERDTAWLLARVHASRQCRLCAHEQRALRAHSNWIPGQARNDDITAFGRFAGRRLLSINGG